ncbi:ABC transporter ATP-binding protein [Polaromonas sp. JS666]|uniref:ABC transporter ATP-binding protein n=1 Tax=Polaromonas sp. (strain JS666 / ATCC BAA-500) TaxID=296591 RepID=UPI0000532310|nr:ABC transporter ATP-binding protein [Polaromonas sp. JS666]ABE42319.1 amino acid/amide ABC transporter ATP-binding protein 1, HAAT family [Polaromonas sp. JS666]
MTQIQVNAMTRRFGGVFAVDQVSTAIPKGEIRGLIGPNGAGKTTLLNLISGALAPSSGEMLMEGKVLSNLRADQRAAHGIRRTFQNLKLFGELTVLENVVLGLHSSTDSGILDAIFRTPRHRREERWALEQSRQALEMVGLGRVADLQASSLAYGHRRLLEIARAIVSQPKVLLLDEPAQGLNPTEASELVQLLRKINETDMTVVLVEHHMDVIMKACSRITVLNYGRVLAEGTPAEIKNDASVVSAYLGGPVKLAEV